MQEVAGFIKDSKNNWQLTNMQFNSNINNIQLK
jgi:hypothetical protein